MNQTQVLQTELFEEDEWQTLYSHHQDEYSRSRLNAIRLLHQGKSRDQVCELVGCSYNTLTSWLKKYLCGGLNELIRPVRYQKPKRLTPAQQQQLKVMVLTQRPTDYGIEHQLWTGAVLSAVIEQRFGVQLKESRIYQILHEMGLSYQRARKDYAHAVPLPPKEWVKIVKQPEISVARSMKTAITQPMGRR